MVIQTRQRLAVSDLVVTNPYATGASAALKLAAQFRAADARALQRR